MTLSQFGREPRLYVVNHLRHLSETKAGELTWWCVDRAAQPGERAAIHLVKRGISVIFTVEDVDQPPESLCAAYGMKTARVKVDYLLTPPLAAREMRAHPVLSKLPALRRSFQRSSFPLPQRFLDAITVEALERQR